MQSSFEQVFSSYHRARNSGKLFDTFYTLHLAKSLQIPLMFSHTDFQHQKLMLRESLLEMLVFFHTGSNREEIERLAERHRDLHVKPEHFDLWLTALCEALAIHDSEFTPDLEQKWRAAMRPGIAVMLAVGPTP